MQAYMKSEMPFYGIPAPLLRKTCRAIFDNHPLQHPDQFRKEVLTIWRNARHREERYAAIQLTADLRARPFQTMDSLPMYEEMIITGAWWDYVDGIAGHRLGEILRHDPRPMRRAMLQWSRDENLWKRRSAILCQLRFKGDTDLELLYATIRPSLASREFFLRKAIGWALRQYAWTDPDEVARFVEQHRELLSPLSRREALKNIPQ